MHDEYETYDYYYYDLLRYNVELNVNESSIMYRPIRR